MWGASTVIDSDPVTTTVRDALYLPINPSVFLDRYDGWGIYNSSGGLVKEAAYYRLHPPVLIGQREQLETIPAAVAAPRGAYLYGGPIIMHYGHFVTTALARLWPIVSGGLEPGAKIVVHAHQSPEDWFTRDYVRTIFGALGLGPEDFVVWNEPTVIKRLVAPRPAFEEQNFVHRVFGRLCAHAGRRMLGSDFAAEPGGPVYLSKVRHGPGTSRLVNEGPLEAAMMSHGAAVAYPEAMPFIDQVRLLAHASCAYGTIGSALHTSLFSPRPSRIVALAYDETVNSNFHLIDRVVGNEAVYVYTPEITPTASDEATFGYIASDPAAIGDALFTLDSGRLS